MQSEQDQVTFVNMPAVSHTLVYLKKACRKKITLCGFRKRELLERNILHKKNIIFNYRFQLFNKNI